ncbi:unnamed protein product [Rotaria sp. Silwood2]|nr:unnamed protein product [Rotaria sp. Silwood2]CAF4074737.1 unnamed protein product [Rotaria sp. Silwood2]CAF4118490.1 unnamed protein product [Rotaria sp. Silwood2]CAF4138799.1 unnamed protein product [Rotaria sp. Silwood2]
MATSESDEIRVSPEKTGKRSSASSSASNSTRGIRFLTSHQRLSRGNSNVSFINEMETIDESTFSISPPNYGYLEHIQSFKPLCKPDDKSLSKKVRDFYDDQLELITSIEDILLPKSDEILVIIKIVGAVISKSLSVISSVVDSIVDLLTSVILIWTARKIKKRDAYKYPGGRTRLEPISIVILSVIMCSASIQVIYQSAETLSQDIEYFTHQHNASSTETLPEINMSTVPIIAMVLTIATLFVLCYRIKSPTMYALAEDNRNDVASNVVALIFGLIASNALHGKIKKEAIVVDPIGAIIISVYIIIAWILQANRQVRRLTGLTAEPSFLQRLTHVVYNYRPDVITKIDSIQATHHGTNFFVEVDIGLPGSMPLAMAHDIGEELQNQLESINDIERAFVHLDFEFSHIPASEHKIV